MRVLRSEPIIFKDLNEPIGDCCGFCSQQIHAVTDPTTCVQDVGVPKHGGAVLPSGVGHCCVPLLCRLWSLNTS